VIGSAYNGAPSSGDGQADLRRKYLHDQGLFWHALPMAFPEGSVRL
jgi:hypothetical protein